MKLILAIDPGTRQSAFVRWNGVKIVECGIVSNEEMLINLNVFEQDDLYIEKISSYGCAVGEETFETVFWTGRFAERWERYAGKNDGCKRVPRMDIKMHLCHTSRAKDPNISQAIRDRFGEVGTKKNPGPLFGAKSHIWAALALAIFAYDERARLREKETSTR